MADARLYLQIKEASPIRERLLVIGEVLWDVFGDRKLLGGAPLNFAAHVARLGHDPVLISAVGNDALGRDAVDSISAFGLATTHIQTSSELPTGTAQVHLDGSGQPQFVIERPAAYDGLRLCADTIVKIAASPPGWLYYGTLFPWLESGRSALKHIVQALPRAKRFYDVNLRPGFESAPLVRELISLANVVKLNENEVGAVAKMTGLLPSYRDFCEAGRQRYGWEAVCITLGARGCAISVGDEYVEADGCKVQVADAVGAGDAFAAAFVHGLAQKWRPADVATFANRLGALVASRPGAIPRWTIEELPGVGQVSQPT